MIIENSKTYNVKEVEEIFFRPIFCGKSADEFGVRVLYNQPMPTKVPLFAHSKNILKSYVAGWQGGPSTYYMQNEVEMKRLKAESSYTAEDYISTVFDYLSSVPEFSSGDLTCSDLEKVETELFRRSIAESVYASMWFGDVEGVVSNISSFDGFIRRLLNINEKGGNLNNVYVLSDHEDCSVVEILNNAWRSAKPTLRNIASDGNLVFYVSSDIYDAYQFYLDDNGLSNCTQTIATGRPVLTYHGIPLVEVAANNYGIKIASSFAILTDRRNFILALNTADSPEKEIHLWYNPDEMENRQRAVFLAGTAIADEALISAYIYDDLTIV
ncbi:MAG: hypothetical protein E7141_00290 [Rikenellaceae bacterium]|nr:hypothetical protein [Rikenellaceae bacterium]